MTGEFEWTVVVPVKRRDAAKTRLQHSLRAELALSFALDVVVAAVGAAGVAAVIVVTADVGAADGARALGADVVADPGSGLNAAVEAGVAAAARIRPGCGVAVVPSDLPALTSRELEAALHLAEQYPLSVVGDAEGVGTTLLTARPGVRLVPDFGGSSFDRHVSAGHAQLDVAPGSGLRRDVDTSADLAAAAARGLGPHTSRAVAAPSG